MINRPNGHSGFQVGVPDTTKGEDI